MRRILYLLVLFAGYSLSAQPFKLVKDINTTRSFYNDIGSISGIAELNGYLYVSIFYWQYGNELWKINKQNGNKEIVKDINPGVLSGAGEVIAHNNLLFLSASDGLTGTELWRSDGTAQGTRIVKDITPGNIGSFPKRFFAYNNNLIFVANGELWKSDGTEQGTVLIKDIYPGGGESDPSNFCIKDGILYFAANDTQYGRELWRSDGTTAGTFMVADIYQGSQSSLANSSESFLMEVINGYLVFEAIDSTHGREIWLSDGTPSGTTILKDFTPGTTSSTIGRGSTVFGTKLYFSVNVNGSVEFWSTDGTVQNTQNIKQLYSTGSGWIRDIVKLKGSLFLRTWSSDSGHEIWKSDGTSPGTERFLQINPSSLTLGMIADANYIYYMDSKQEGDELWVSDGTSTAPRIVKDIEVGLRSSYPTAPQLINSQLYFRVQTTLNGVSIWKSDGSSAGTLPVIQSREGTDDADPFYLTAFKNAVYFTANDSIHGTEIWRSDGTEAGTFLLKDIVPGAGSSYPINFIAADTNLFFIPGGAQLWKTNGTPEGTLRVQPLVNAYAENEMKLLNGLVYFVGARPGAVQIWKTDGTDAGTVPADNSFAYTSVEELVAFKETIFFRGSNATNGLELWKIDKSLGRAILLKDIWPGPNNGYPRNFKVAGNYLYFSADNGSNGSELWRTDGTTAGTIMLEIMPGPSPGFAVGMTAIGDEIYFSASDSVHGTELWKSNGTVAGTLIVKDIHPGISNSIISNLFSSKQNLYFDVRDPATGTELWKSDGTADGTVMLNETWPGPYGNDAGLGTPTQAVLPDGKFVHTRANGIYGQEPWISDGTSSGTVVSQDLFPGSGSSRPRFYTVAGDKVYFAANTPDFGIELWVGNINELYPKLQITFNGRLQNNNAILDWQTIHEHLLDKFEIQRSPDAISFSKIGESIPNGGLGIPADYSFKDSNVTQLNKSPLYYRLGIRDTAGAYTYSDTITIAVPNPITKSAINVWPNPTSGDLNITLESPSSEEFNFVLYDPQGRMLRKWSSSIAMGITSDVIHLQVLNAGVYYLSVKSNSLQQLIKVVKM